MMDTSDLSIPSKTSLLRNKRTDLFFRQDATTVAQRLLGDYLVMQTSRGYCAGRIVETESYPGRRDDASHTFGGKRTPRTEILYHPGPRVYTYQLYGRYCCFNIVVAKKNEPQAVCIRALEPVYGISLMKKRRKVSDTWRLTNGPCRWTEAFGITKRLWGIRMSSHSLFISRPERKSFIMVKAKRIGVDYAPEGKNRPLRFYIKDNPFVSRR